MKSNARRCGNKAKGIGADARVCAGVVGAFAALLFAGAPAAAQGVYAALAISPSTGAYGYGYNDNTQAQADERAMNECKKHAQDCKVYARFQRQCIAVARATNNAFG